MAVFFSIVIIVIAGFLIGSVPFGLLIARFFCGIDPRQSGSGNVGATNVSRLCGLGWGLATLACDLLKGYVPVLILVSSGRSLGYLVYPLGLAVICGHMFSLFLGFKGGKGVATLLGVFLALAPVQLIMAGALCIAVIWRSGYVSAGSLALVAALPLLFVFSGRWGDALYALLVAGLIIYTHRSNIRRLLRGEEKPWLKTSV